MSQYKPTHDSEWLEWPYTFEPDHAEVERTEAGAPYFYTPSVGVTPERVCAFRWNEGREWGSGLPELCAKVGAMMDGLEIPTNDEFGLRMVALTDENGTRVETIPRSSDGGLVVWGDLDSEEAADARTMRSLIEQLKAASDVLDNMKMVANQRKISRATLPVPSPSCPLYTKWYDSEEFVWLDERLVSDDSEFDLGSRSVAWDGMYIYSKASYSFQRDESVWVAASFGAFKPQTIVGEYIKTVAMCDVPRNSYAWLRVVGYGGYLIPQCT